MAQGRKATRQNTFIFLKLLCFFSFSVFCCAPLLVHLYSVDLPFISLILILHIPKLYSPKLVLLITFHALILQFGQTKGSLLKDQIKGGVKVFHMALMMKLVLVSNKVLGFMHICICISKVGFKRHKIPKDGLNHFLLVVMPRISP